MELVKICMRCVFFVFIYKEIKEIKWLFSKIINCCDMVVVFILSVWIWIFNILWNKIIIRYICDIFYWIFGIDMRMNGLLGF